MFNRTDHIFHVPVMGLGFSIDTPIKVAHYGIDSVISIIDDDLIEKMRKVHSRKSGLPFQEISTKEYDYRAKRVTAYLNLVNEIVQKNFRSLKESFGEKNGEFEKYISMLPNGSELKIKYYREMENGNLNDFKDWIFSKLKLGSIDANIMTKVDKPNYHKNEKLPVQFNDAHAALRGFARSELKSSIVLSAGMNPRLYSYFEEFEDFYPNEKGELNKKIILKVSDYRSALIQGKFLAKKGLWVSEFRIESGLNCGGHAFATDGFLMGPILEEFKSKREELLGVTHSIYSDALAKKNKAFNGIPFEQKITAQGGVGTCEEQNFLIDYYNIESVGWGTPFLLVPEATNVDSETLQLLSKAREDDLYLSKISPLGVPFNSIKGVSKEIEKYKNALNGKAGSACPKKHLQSNTEFSEKPICTASRAFQSKKIQQLEAQNLDKYEFQKEYEKIVEKACLCVGLATSALKSNNASTKIDGEGVLICPGPNLAYFSSIVSLKEMVNHIYGRVNLVQRTDRPNLFIKELNLYINYLKEKAAEINGDLTSNQRNFFLTFVENLTAGINYYYDLFGSLESYFKEIKSTIMNDLQECEMSLHLLTSEIEDLSLEPRYAEA